MRLLCSYFTVLSLALVCTCAQADVVSKHQIAAAELSGLFNAPSLDETNDSSGAGAYFYLLSKLLEDTGLDKDYEIIVLPMKRAKIDFSRKHFACYAPGLDTFDPLEREALPTDILSSSHFNHAVVKVLNRKDTAMVTTENDVSKKHSISIVRGVPVNARMQQMLENAAKFYLVTSEYENLLMLKSGRVTYSMVYYPDVLAAYRQLNITEPFAFDPDFSPHTIKDNLLCHKEHKLAFDKLEQAIQRYRDEGILQQILHDYFLEDEFL